MINYTIRYDVAGALITIAVMLSYFREKKIKTKISDSFTALTRSEEHTSELQSQ